MNQLATESKSARVLNAGPPQAASTPQVAESLVPAHDEIALRAFEIYENSGREPGHCVQNWHKASQEVRQVRETTRQEHVMQNEGGGSCAASTCGCEEASDTASIVKPFNASSRQQPQFNPRHPK